MNKHARWVGTFFLLCVWWTAASAAWAFHGVKPAGLPDWDARKGEFFRAPYVQPDQQAALAQLRAAAPGVSVQRHAVVGTPQVIRTTRGFLTAPAGNGQAMAPADADQPVRNFLNAYAPLFGEGATLLDRAVVQSESVSAAGGLRTKIWQQEWNGIPVFEGTLAAHSGRQGQLLTVSSRMVPQLAQAIQQSVPNHAQLAAAPPVSAPAAVARAAQHIGLDLNANQVVAAGIQHGWQKFTAPGLGRQALARLTWLPLKRDVLTLAWDVWVSNRANGHSYRVLVDAQTGQVWLRRFMTRYLTDASYRVYTGDSPTPFSPGCSSPCTTQPPEVPRAFLTLSALDPVASPLGWIADGDNETLGNNVDASTDLDGDEIPDVPRPTGSPFRVFDFPLSLTNAPSSYSLAAAVQLFYRLNWAHDRLWSLGFNEAAGNFQEDNFGRGGLDGDPVWANAQSPVAVNNAYFSPAPDGISPSLTMGIFTGPTPDRDTSLDSEIILHEYSHGVSDRLTGGLLYADDYQSGALQEGWSDWLAIALLAEASDDPDGTYAPGAYAVYQLFAGFNQNYYFGIRRYPYSTDLSKNPLTYKDIDDSQASSHPGVPISPLGWENYGAGEVHNAGEVWCAILWEVHAALVKKHGFATGNLRALQAVLGGMKLLYGSDTPSFLDARDAILAASFADYGNEDRNTLWAAFAKRGLGHSARSPADGSNFGVVEAYDVPALEVAGFFVTGGNGNDVIDPNECVQLSIILTNITDTAIEGELGAQLVSQTLGVIVETPSRGYPTVPPYGTATNTVPFDISTSSGFACGRTIQFRLTVKTGLGFSTFTVPVPTVSGTMGPYRRFNQNTPLAIADNATVESTIEVSGVEGAVMDVALNFYIEHTFTGDLEIYLISPDNTVVPVSLRNGGGGDNFGTNCVPDDARTGFNVRSGVSIRDGVPPFLGTYLVEGDLRDFNGKSGASVNGTWRLRIRDALELDTGTLQCWSLFIAGSTCTNGTGPCTSQPMVCVEESLTFGPQGAGTTSAPQTLRVQNCGTENLIITNVVLAGTNPTDFGIVGNNCIGATLAPGQSCQIQVVFSPQPPVFPDEDARRATLEIYDNAADSPQRITLSGTPVQCGNGLITPPFLADAFLGLPYEAQLSVDGALGTVTFFRTAGNYPPGITMDTTGFISGIPTATGNFSFKVKVIDDVDCQSEKFYTLRVRCAALASLPAALPVGQIGVAYSQQLTGIGGTAPYTFQQEGGSLPAGMTLSSDGLLSGTPTSGSSVFGVRVTDANGCSSLVTYTITLADPPPIILVDPPALRAGAINVAYSQTLVAQGGAAPHSFSLESGSLPAGVSLSSAGLLSGTPAQTGSATFTVRATDALGRVGSRAYLLAIKPGITDLAVSLVPSAATVTEGDPVTYTITVRNHGQLPAANVQVAGTLAAQLGTIEPGASATAQVTITAEEAGTLTQTVSVDSDLADSEAGNDVATAQVAVQARIHSTVHWTAANWVAAAGKPVLITLQRVGNTQKPATVGYYTVDGTARAGVDYVAASGVVMFGAGESSKTVAITVLGSATTDRSFQVRLSTPGKGVALGALTQATVTIGRPSAGNSLTFQDVDGDGATIQLLGPGALGAAVAGDGSLEELTVTGSDSSSSLIVVVRRGAAGDGRVGIGRIAVTGSLKALTVGATELVGTRVEIAGSLGSLRAGGLTRVVLKAGGAIGTVRAGAVTDSLVAAGFEASDAADPFAGGVFVAGSGLRGIKAQRLANSTIAAALVGKVQLGAVATDNGGRAFGVLARDGIGAVTVSSPTFKWNKAGHRDQAVGDFHVRW